MTYPTRTIIKIEITTDAKGGAKFNSEVTEQTMKNEEAGWKSQVLQKKRVHEDAQDLIEFIGSKLEKK